MVPAYLRWYDRLLKIIQLACSSKNSDKTYPMSRCGDDLLRLWLTALYEHLDCLHCSQSVFPATSYTRSPSDQQPMHYHIRSLEPKKKGPQTVKLEFHQFRLQKRYKTHITTIHDSPKLARRHHPVKCISLLLALPPRPGTYRKWPKSGAWSVTHSCIERHPQDRDIEMGRRILQA